MSFAAPRSTYRPQSAKRSRRSQHSTSRPQTAGASLRSSISSTSLLGRGGASSSLAIGKPVNRGKPPKANPFRVRNSVPEQFRRFYNRGDLPVAVKHGATRSLHWKVKPEELDYHHYLPLFFEGLRDKEEPYKFIAERGVSDLLTAGSVSLYSSHNILSMCARFFLDPHVARACQSANVVLPNPKMVDT